MNKYFILLAVLVLIIGGGVAYKQYGGKIVQEETGATKEFTVYARKNQWNWDPDTFAVDQGDRVKITVINGDDYDH